VDLISFILCLLVFFVGLAVFSNRFRRTHLLEFELKPNCLLTRWPVVFVTGSRSLFYFSRYWNLYPVFLAEHGYEVFTIHLPWKSQDERRARLRGVLNDKDKKFHLVMDANTALELKEILQNHPAVMSVTTLRDSGAKNQLPFYSIEMTESPSISPLLASSYWLHRKFIGTEGLPSLDTLGALPKSALNNSRLLLARMQELAETDYQN
jgi:hypothetical protein